MYADGETAILTPFLLILIFWLAVVFASYSLFVEPDRVVVAALLAFALDIERAVPHRGFEPAVRRSDADPEGTTPPHAGAVGMSRAGRLSW
jgi:hypothetical protein